MQFCVFNPRARRWNQSAWAYVKDDKEARQLSEKYGYMSWQFQDEESTPAFKLWKSEVRELKLNA